MPFFGSFFPFRAGSVGFLQEVWKEYGDTTSFGLGPYDVWMVVHPDQVRHVLSAGVSRYEKNRLYRNLEVVTGPGLTTSNGELWSRHRRVVQPGFHRRVLKGVVRKVEGRTRMVAVEARGAPVDLRRWMPDLALANLGECLFGSAFEDERITWGLPYALRYVHGWMYRVLKWPLEWRLGGNRAFRDAVDGMWAAVDDFLAMRMRESTSREDVVDLLILAYREGRLEWGEVRAEVATLIMAGHETTALALVWAWNLLGQHPEVLKAAREEAREVGDLVKLGERLPQSLPLIEGVLREAMRLYPPTWWFGRAPVVDDQVAGWSARAGQIVSVCPYLTHRHPEFWEAPEVFKPERFGSGVPKDGRYFPFAMGPRKCAGEHLAMLEMVTVMATLLREFDVRVTADLGPPEGGIQLRPSGPVMATIRRRDS